MKNNRGKRLVREKSQRMILYLSDFIYMHIQTLQGKGSESQAAEGERRRGGNKKEKESGRNERVKSKESKQYKSKRLCHKQNEDDIGR